MNEALIWQLISLALMVIVLYMSIGFNQSMKNAYDVGNQNCINSNIDSLIDIQRLYSNGTRK